MREKLKDLKDYLWSKFKSNAEDAAEDLEDLRYDHPFLFGHIEGCVAIYWAIIISSIIMSFKGKELGWVDKK